MGTEAAVPNVIRATMVTEDEITGALVPVAIAFVGLVRSMTPESAAEPVPGLTWTAGEVAVHVLTVVRRGRDLRRADSLDGLRDLNALCIEEVDERDPKAVAALLESEFTAAPGPREETIALHVGLVADRATALSYALGDLLVHGYDIAAATGLPWTIPSEHAAVCLRAIVPAMAPWVRPRVLAGPAREVVLGLGDDGPPVHVAVGDGRYTAVAASPAGVPRTDAGAPTALLAAARQVTSGDDVLDRWAGWYLPI